MNAYFGTFSTIFLCDDVIEGSIYVCNSPFSGKMYLAIINDKNHIFKKDGTTCINCNEAIYICGKENLIWISIDLAGLTCSQITMKEIFK